MADEIAAAEVEDEYTDLREAIASGQELTDEQVDVIADRGFSPRHPCHLRRA